MKRYAQRHAEPLARTAAGKALSSRLPVFSQAVIVPLYAEPEDSLGRVFARLEDSDTLVIAVVNAPSNAPDEARRATRRLLDCAADSTALTVLTVDCISAPLDARSAVGTARKIGTDTALLLHLAGRVISPWLYQTDADAQLPKNYFSGDMPEQGAVVFGHRHLSADPRLQLAVDLYDRHMAYYAAGLKAAGSAYAYPSLGSTISVHAHSYAAVRGFPKRNAGEDFYLLNKIAKVHGIDQQPATVIELAARLSERVPFGTGPALRNISTALQQDPSGASFLSYHPASFQLLGEALDLLEQFARAQPDRSLQTWRALSSGRAAGLLDKLRFGRVAERLTRQNTSPQQRRRMLQEWMDAGKTLRFVHEARRFHPDQPLLETLQNLPAQISRHLNEPL